jgi:ATPase subunit of ABC transporter with duplicated ATPase domains
MNAGRSAGLVIDDLTIRYGGAVAVSGLSVDAPVGLLTGLIGPNGAGKTTLFRMIAGEERPDGGTLRLGDTVQLAYVDQSREALMGERTVWEEVSGGQDVIRLGGREEVSSRAYVASFNFRGADQQKPVGHLSGGERNRVHLAKLLAGGGNLILLDEPTNDLDVDTLRALEEALAAWSGSAMITSHDRWFLDRIATHILAFEGDSQVTWFEGNYQEYEDHRRRTLGEEGARPRRITYRRLTAPG